MTVEKSCQNQTEQDHCDPGDDQVSWHSSPLSVFFDVETNESKGEAEKKGRPQVTQNFFYVRHFSSFGSSARKRGSLPRG